MRKLFGAFEKRGRVPGMWPQGRQEQGLTANNPEKVERSYTGADWLKIETILGVNKMAEAMFELAPVVFL